MKTKYINVRTNHGGETIDQFPVNTKEERKELFRCLREYKLIYSNVWASSRACKGWNK